MHSEELEINNGGGQSFGYTLYRQRLRVTKKNPIMKLKGKIRDIVIVFVDGIRQTEVLNDHTQLSGFGFWNSRYAEHLNILYTLTYKESLMYEGDS